MLSAASSLAEEQSLPRQPACPVCRSATEDFFHLPRLPVDVGVLHDSPESARNAAMAEVRLAYCPSCGFVFNRSFQPQRLSLTTAYEVQLVHSSLFSEFLTSLAERLVRKYELHGKRLFDAGCGAGHFLRMLCELGGNQGLGMDATIRDEGRVTLRRGEMQLVRGWIGAGQTCDWPADFAVCQSVLENVPGPVQFLSIIREMLLARQGHAYLEVFNAQRAFAAGEVWSLTYEQCNYYSLEAFGELIRRAGFEIVESGLCYGDGQYLYVEAKPALSESAIQKPQSMERPAAIAQFAQLHQRRLAQWQDRIKAFRSLGQKAAIWGTGGKGICFLNTLGAEDVFVWAVDINPERQNRYVPGSAQPIIGPARLQSVRPDVVIITNPLYESEIRNAVAQLNLKCDFLTI